MYLLLLYFYDKNSHIYSCSFHETDTTTDIAICYLRNMIGGHEYIEQYIRVYEF
jgi:hypothetical protein